MQISLYRYVRMTYIVALESYSVVGRGIKVSLAANQLQAPAETGRPRRGLVSTQDDGKCTNL